MKSAGPAPRTVTNEAPELRARGRADPTRGGGCPAPPAALAPPSAPRRCGVAGARRGLWPGTPGPAPPPDGARSPGAAPQGLGYDHDCGAGAGALRGGGTGNSDLSGPGAAAAAAFCVRSAAAGRGRGGLPPGPPPGSQPRRAAEPGTLRRGTAGRGRGRKLPRFVCVHFYLFIFSDRDYFCLNPPQNPSYKLSRNSRLRCRSSKELR